MTARRAVALALVFLIVAPAVAHAWTPGTHVYLGEAVMRSLALLPPSIAALLKEFPYDFLYGSIAADTSIAKKYVPVGRHCHSWNVGMEILDGAGDDPLRAFGLGYLSHLAADSVAHNYFVPKQLAVTSSTSGLGHSYWESRFETHLGTACARSARELILLDHSRSDGLLDRVLSPTIFSTSTNRRIFRGMVIVADNESWQRIFQLMKENSRWDLPDDEVGAYVARSYDFIIDMLQRMDRSEPFRLDPSGDEALRLAKKVRRKTLREVGDHRLHEEADRVFGMPDTTLPFSRNLADPLYVPTRVASN
ncbi:MAG TPA: zinc dependent phospholipase C family protein [Gemmatimonadaceae bacterium]|nr:zinc dependent phospholipase C family protein [Gemmatimonadaceae bacterium]